MSSEQCLAEIILYGKELRIKAHQRVLPFDKKAAEFLALLTIAAGRQVNARTTWNIMKKIQRLPYDGGYFDDYLARLKIELERFGIEGIVSISHAPDRSCSIICEKIKCDYYRALSQGTAKGNRFGFLGSYPWAELVYQETWESLNLLWKRNEIGLMSLEDPMEAFVGRLSEENSDKLWRMAYVDPLTEVKNWRAYRGAVFDIEKDKKVAGNKYALAVYHVNRLKYTNDTMGFVAGDEKVKAAAGILGEVFRYSAIYRISGDEFAVILTGNDYSLGDSVLEMVTEKTGSDKAAIPPLAAGYARCSEGESFTDVFERAEAEMRMERKRQYHEYPVNA